jgi:23S rRNA (uracil1939-C5)-methyltransferase
MDKLHTATISSLAHGGYGVCRIAGQVCFVAYGLPGDVIRVRVIKESKGVLWGVIDSLVQPSPDRVEPPCSRFGVDGCCGGCMWVHFAYPAQEQWKRRIVRDCLERIAKIDTEVGWVENAELRHGWRTRAEFHGSEGRLGFHRLGSHEVVDIERCPLCHDNLNRVLGQLRALPIRGTVEVVVNPEGSEVMIAAKRPHRSLRKAFKLVNALDDERPHQFLFDGVPIVNGAFSQSSLLLNRMLVGIVSRMIGDAESVLDLYCGNGNFSLQISGKARVLGLDHNRRAVIAANEIVRGTYRPGDESDFCRALKDAWDVVILDPPRTGARSIVDALAESPCKRIVYVSCDPATLARDLRRLVDRGWRLAECVAVDLFPNTAHVETICQLER